MPSKLPVPAQGVCAGHPCDDCRTCRIGHCCRHDNPDYSLPKLGDWTAPTYVPLGEVRSSDGVTLDCHICGEAYHSVGLHAFMTHDVTANEYRVLFGLSRSTSLFGPEYQDRQRERVRREIAEGRRDDWRGNGRYESTREQLSQYASAAHERERQVGKRRRSGQENNRGVRVRRNDPGRYDRAVERLRAGQSRRQVALETGLAHGTVTRIKKEAGLT